MILLLDAFSNNYVPFHLITLEFFKIISEKLTSNGVLVLIFVSSILGDTSKLWRAIYKTMSEVFPSLYAFRTDYEDPTIVQAIVLVATKARTDFSKDKLKQIVYKNNLGTMSDDIMFIEHLYDGNKIRTDDVPIVVDKMDNIQNLIDPVTSKPYIISDHDNVVRRPHKVKSFGMGKGNMRMIMNEIIWQYNRKHQDSDSASDSVTYLR